MISSFSIDDLKNLWDSILSLDFAIPDEIFTVLSSLTNFVGYIMPLRLYTPIIALVLGYWFLMILAASLRFVFNMVKKIINIIALSGGG